MRGQGGGGVGTGVALRIFNTNAARMPPLSISELNKGDAVMLVATQGSMKLAAMQSPCSRASTILSAAPAGATAATILSPWNLGAPAGAGGKVLRSSLSVFMQKQK